jgi:hypothetical protein
MIDPAEPVSPGACNLNVLQNRDLPYRLTS